MLAAMVAASALGATRGRVVSYANSGDLPIGDPERVVGYGAVVFTAGAPGADVAVLLPHARRAQALPPTPSDKKLMLALARETIRRYLDTETVPLARGFSPSLDRPQGVFVTLKTRRAARLHRPDAARPAAPGAGGQHGARRRVPGPAVQQGHGRTS